MTMGPGSSPDPNIYYRTFFCRQGRQPMRYVLRRSNGILWASRLVAMIRSAYGIRPHWGRKENGLPEGELPRRGKRGHPGVRPYGLAMTRKIPVASSDSDWRLSNLVGVGGAARPTGEIAYRSPGHTFRNCSSVNQSSRKIRGIISLRNSPRNTFRQRKAASSGSLAAVKRMVALLPWR